MGCNACLWSLCATNSNQLLLWATPLSERSHCWKGLWSLEVHFAKAWAGWLYLDVMQVTSPVQWETTLKTLLGKGLQSSYELGPGKVMSRLILLFICECVPHSALLHTWIFIPTVITNSSMIKVTRIAWPTTGFPPNPRTKLLWISTSTCFFEFPGTWWRICRHEAFLGHYLSVIPYNRLFILPQHWLQFLKCDSPHQKPFNLTYQRSSHFGSITSYYNINSLKV